MAYAEYLEIEAGSDVKHEYLRGEAWAMAGGTPEHGRVAIRVAAALTQALSGKPCEVFSSDVKLRIVDTDLTTYPDLQVVRGPLEAADDDPNAITNPLIIVEVLSDSTEAYDRGDKFAHYQRIGSLKEYILVSQREPRIEIFRRRAHGEWSYAQAGAGGILEIESIEAKLDVDAIFRTQLPQQES